MSVIVGLKRDGVIHMSADSFVGSNHDRNASTVDMGKLFTVGDALVGFSGEQSVLNAVRYRMELPEHGANESDEHYMAVKFVDAMRDAIGSAGRRKRENELDTARVWMLVGYRGRLWRVDNDFSVCEHDRSYEAVGAGQDHALGVLYWLDGSDMDPRSVLNAALDAACEHNNYCRPPYVYDELSP